MAYGSNILSSLFIFLEQLMSTGGTCDLQKNATFIIKVLTPESIFLSTWISTKTEPGNTEP